MPNASSGPGPARLFVIFLRLGLTAFGGPTAHLAYFREVFVRRRGWLSEEAYAALIALCQAIPGPASSQVGIAIGRRLAGTPGALAAWLGFTVPSTVVMLAFAYGLIQQSEGPILGGMISGLQVAAVAVVIVALWGMAQRLCPDRLRSGIALAAAAGVGLTAHPLMTVATLAAGGLVGWRYLALPAALEPTVRRSTRGSLVWLAAFGAGLLVLPVAAALTDHEALRLCERFFRVGALTFGGGHVVLPLLERELVAPGWVDPAWFLAGYGAAQALPGPLFTFSAFLGHVTTIGPGGWLGGLLALVGLFAPGFLLVMGLLPYWERIAQHRGPRAALAGVNAAVVGLLLAVLLGVLWPRIGTDPSTISALLILILILGVWGRSPVWVVLGSGAVGGLWGGLAVNLPGLGPG